MGKYMLVGVLTACAAFMAEAAVPFTPGAKTSTGRINTANGRRMGEMATRRENLELEAQRKMERADSRRILPPPGTTVDVAGLLADVDLERRIDALCGFEIGTIARGFRPKVNDGGDIVLTNKLARPFRNCKKAEVMYSQSNCALFSIKVFSEPLKMTDEEAKAEMQVMADAFKQKFGDKIEWGREMSCRIANKNTRSATAKKLMAGANGPAADNKRSKVSAIRLLATGQSLVISREKRKLVSMFSTRAPRAKDEYVWVFTVELKDELVKTLTRSALNPPPKVAPSKSDIDAL